MHHPYYGSFPLHHFKSVFPSLLPLPSAFYSPTTSTAASSAFSSVNVAPTSVSEVSNNSSPSLEQDKKDNTDEEEDIEEENIKEKDETKEEMETKG